MNRGQMVKLMHALTVQPPSAPLWAGRRQCKNIHAWRPQIPEGVGIFAASFRTLKAVKIEKRMDGRVLAATPPSKSDDAKHQYAASERYLARSEGPRMECQQRFEIDIAAEHCYM